MYLYISEDGTIKKSDNAPGNADLLMVGDGTLEVILIKGDDVFHVDEKRSLTEIDVAEYDEDEDFHF
jgi:hypothetical protein